MHILKDQVKDMNSILLFSKFTFLQLPGAPTRPLAKIAALCRSSFPLSGRHLTITSALRPSSLNLAPSAPSSTGFTQIQLSPFSLRMGRINKYLCHKQGPASTYSLLDSNSEFLVLLELDSDKTLHGLSSEKYEHQIFLDNRTIIVLSVKY